MNQTSSKNRKIQILRAIAIFNVVIGHTCPYGVSGVLVRAVINFCVPLFFFLSGYLTKMENDDWKGFCLRRVKRVFIPYLLWNLLYAAYTRNFNGFLFRLLTGTSVASCYFVSVYIQFVIFTPLIAKLIKSKYRWTGWLIQPAALIVLKYLGFGQYVVFHDLLSWFGPFYLGMCLGNRIIQWNGSYRKTSFLCAVSLIISIAESLAWYYAGNYEMATTVLELSNCLYATAWALLAYKYLTDDTIPVRESIINRILITMGDCSFGIYLSHMFVLIVVQRLPGYQYLVFPFTSILVLAVSTAFIYCGHRLLGDRYGKYFGFC